MQLVRPAQRPSAPLDGGKAALALSLLSLLLLLLRVLLLLLLLLQLLLNLVLQQPQTQELQNCW